MKLPRFYIKKLDRFIIKAFLRNLMATFFICLFIFIVQLIWKWVDDFVGKGLDISIIAQFFGLGSLTLVSRALPLAILLASLMTFGNFGEKFELLAMKSAGIPLLRTMLPLFVCSAIMGGVSFYFQNVVTPMAQTKLMRIMYSIKQTSPESDIPERTFYNKLNGYNIYVEHKNKETGMLYNVTIYDMSAGFEKANILVSDSAIIKNTADEMYMVLTMYSGEQFSNLDDQNINKKNAPYRRESFTKKVVVIEMESGFKMRDADFLKAKADGKNMEELIVSIDSLTLSNDSIGRANLRQMKRSNYTDKITLDSNDSTMMANDNIYWMNVDSIYNVATKKMKLAWKREELRTVSSLKNNYEINGKIMRQLDKDLNRHWIYWWEKITLSLGCIIFLLIGAPLGSIVRRGGLGYPVIISVATFILYYIFDTSGSKMAAEGEWKIWIGAWLSTMVLAPMGLFFTYQANKDSGILKNDAIRDFFKKLFAISEKRNIQLKDIIIDTPDYNKCYEELNNIYKQAHRYKKTNKLKRLPSLKKVFFNENDNVINSFNEKLESVIEELSNSKYRKIIIFLNEIPILSHTAIKSPFSKRWHNILLIIAVPFNIIIYIRSIRCRIKLLIDLTKIEKRIKQIMNIMVKEKLIEKI